MVGTNGRLVSISRTSVTPSPTTSTENRFYDRHWQTRPQIAAKFNWASQRWELDNERGSLPGLAIYARHDGSFAIWDAGRAFVQETSAQDISERGVVKLSAREVWNGLKDDDKKLEYWVCNGLIRDWVSWQSSIGLKNCIVCLPDAWQNCRLIVTSPLVPANPFGGFPGGT